MLIRPSDPEAPPKALPGIHYARKLDQTLYMQYKSEMGTWTRFLSLEAELTALPILGAILVTVEVNRRSPTSFLTDPLPTLAAGGLFVLLFLLAIRLKGHRVRELARHAAPQSEPYPDRSDSRYRVRVVGSKRNLDALRAMPADMSAGFEPVIVRLTCADEPRRTRRRKAASLMLGGTVVTGFIQFVVLHLEISYLTFIVGCLVGRLILTFAWPTYLRLSPGRLDVFQYPLLGRGSPGVRTYDLRTSSVVVSLWGPPFVKSTSRVAYEIIPSGSAMWTESEPFQFERAVLLAALTTAPTPPLPDDALIG